MNDIADDTADNLYFCDFCHDVIPIIGNTLQGRVMAVTKPINPGEPDGAYANIEVTLHPGDCFKKFDPAQFHVDFGQD